MKKLISLLMLLTVASSAYMPTMQAGEVYARQQTKNRKIEITRPQATEIQTILSCFTRAS